MFTGLIQDIGTLVALDKKGDWSAAIASEKLAGKLALGSSIACDGICLTVVEKNTAQFKVQMSGETLSRTTAAQWQKGRRINLEPALRAGDELGGHLLAGHVDGLARVAGRKAMGDSLIYTFDAPVECAKFIAEKGSVALNGVSLTVNEVIGARFSVALIPFTRQMTNLDALAPGNAANFEADMIARYVGRIIG